MFSQESIEIITFSSTVQGPHLLILGAVHGDEKCGPKAIRKIVKSFRLGAVPILRGSVTFIPVCNPKAYKKNVRFIETNMNRVFSLHKKPRMYEKRTANVLVEWVNRCDYLLDIHSFPSQGLPFVFQDYDDLKTKSFARSLNVSFIVKGWPELYAAPEAAQKHQGDSCAYAHSKGKIGVVIECGENKDPQSVVVAQQAILNALAFLRIVNCKEKKEQKPKEIAITDIFFKKKEGFFTKNWKHLEKIKKGTVIAEYFDGSKEIASQEGYLFLPNEKVVMGGEWFYFAQVI